MTSLPELTFTWTIPSAHVGRLTLAGNVVYVNAEDLLRAVVEHLNEQPDLRELLIDCTGLEICDSRGLSTLLMLRRRTQKLGLTLKIVNRPKVLDRMLERTGTADYLACAEKVDAQKEGG